MKNRVCVSVGSERGGEGPVTLINVSLRAWLPSPFPPLPLLQSYSLRHCCHLHQHLNIIQIPMFIRQHPIRT